ncbi:MAG: bifunctional nuclease family protein [Muribaculaceae bacterium]|nr:bifunctional nuclease family protein [Muribaculaceae bacterium]
MERIELTVLGISYNPLKDNAYALLLEQKDGPTRLPIVIGMSEAQSIQAKVMSIVPPRPLTHDLMVSIMHRFGIFPDFVEIYSFENGVFASHIQLTGKDGDTWLLDSRTSDAVALAVRVNCPIYTTRDILDRAGYVPDEDGVPITRLDTLPLDELPVERLEARLQQCIADEDYERAAEIKKIIEQKTQQS